MTPLLPAFTGTPHPDKVYQCDALSLLRAMPDKSADAIISDPPYGVEYKGWDVTPSQLWLDECLRVATGSVVWFGASPIYALQSVINLSPAPDRLLIWSPSFTLKKATLNSMYYRFHPIYVWRPPEKQSGLYSDVITTPTDGHNWWNHPATKPLKLMRKIVEAFSVIGGTVIDPFAGSGTTLVAAQHAGRQYIGCDLEYEYVEIARARLAAPYTPSFMPQLDLTA